MAVNVVLKSVWDDKGIKNAQKAIQDFNAGFDKAFKAVGVAAAAAGAAIALFAKQSITAASSLEESTNAVNVAFGKSADEVLKIGENAAQSFGLARTEFNQAAVRFSAFAERVVGAGGDVAGFIGEVTQRASDFASVFNIQVSEALQVFQSGLSGEAEPLKRFGINLLDSEVKAYALRTGLIAVGETMTEQEKVQARYGLLLESTAKTAGDFANTSDSLANQQRILTATFTDLQAEIGTALLPVVGQLVRQFADFLIPKLEQLGKWINSPDGKKAVQDFGDAIGNVLKSAFDFGDWFVKNFDTIKDFFIAIGIGLVTMRALTGAIQIATGAMALFNGVSAANIFVAAAAAIALIAAGMYLVYQNTEKANDALEEQRIAILKTEDAWVTAATAGSSAYKGLIPGLEYATEATSDLGTQGLVAADHIRDLNNIRLQGLRNEITGTTGELNRFRNLSNKFVAAFKPIEEGGGGGGGGGGGATGPTAFERVQKFIKDSQKDLAKAQETYNKTIAAAQKRYAEQVLKTEQDFANKLADIIQQSQDRLRTAFESVVRVSLADIFEVEETKSVANLIAGLTNRLSKSQALLEKAGKLNAAGFSQTFIEQVVQAGTDTGNELASAILESTPQTQAELQRLFLALEATAETGMDSLAREIYNKQGLATRELKNLYVQTQLDLTEALKELQLDFNQEVIDANMTLIEAVKKIREAFQENIESMKGDLGGLDRVVSEFLKKLGQVETKAEEKIQNITGTTPGVTGGAAGGGMTGINLAASSVRDATGIFIDSMSDVSRVIEYLNERINAANRFANESAIAGRTAEAMSAVNLRNEFRSQLGLIQSLGTGAVGTTININVKTDSTQSLAMVGKTLGNTITKYVSAGGQVLVSPTN
jgi:DNA-directed RNA polymerase subunit F